MWLNRGLPDTPFLRFEVGMLACYRRDYKMVHTIKADHTWPHDFVLYNLILGGSHTYHVNGYLVTGWPQDVDFNYATWQPTGVQYIIPKRGIR